jgi:hypothetical protein
MKMDHGLEEIWQMDTITSLRKDFLEYIVAVESQAEGS